MLKSFGLKLKLLRKKRGFKLREFADKVKVSPAYICNIERGNLPNTIISEETIAKMAKVLKVNSSILLVEAGTSIVTTIKEINLRSDLDAEKLSIFLDEIKKKRPSEEDWADLISRAKKMER